MERHSLKTCQSLKALHHRTYRKITLLECSHPPFRRKHSRLRCPPLQKQSLSSPSLNARQDIISLSYYAIQFRQYAYLNRGKGKVFNMQLLLPAHHTNPQLNKALKAEMSKRDVKKQVKGKKRKTPEKKKSMM